MVDSNSASSIEKIFDSNNTWLFKSFKFGNGSRMFDCQT